MPSRTKNKLKQEKIYLHSIHINCYKPISISFQFIIDGRQFSIILSKKELNFSIFRELFYEKRKIHHFQLTQKQELKLFSQIIKILSLCRIFFK